MRRLLPLVAAVAALVPAAPAGAQTATTAAPTATTAATTGTTTTGTTPAPAPAGGTLRLSWVQPIVLRGHVLALAGRAVVVRGRVSQYRPGQKAVVKAYRNGKLFFRRTVAIRGVGGGRGGFRLSILSRRAGALGILADHAATPQQRKLHSNALRTRAHAPAARFGQRSAVVDLIQRQLGREHYAVVRSRRFDGSTARALLAFRKVNHFRRTGTVNAKIIRMLLALRGQFHAKYPGHGRHVEGDISRQVLALINKGGKVYRVYHMSSGKPSTPTVLGSFRFYRKSYGTNSHGMVHSSYFIRGYAIHGYSSVPAYNASHGCLRVPIPSALGIFRWTRIGQRIDVYR